MNNGRIWCVVNPTVGLPLFLGSVALMAFTVHFAVLNNTTWFSAYWNGNAPAKTAQTTGTAPVAQAASGSPAFVVDVAPKAEASGTSFVITVTPKAGDAPVLKTADARPTGAQ